MRIDSDDMESIFRTSEVTFVCAIHEDDSVESWIRALDSAIPDISHPATRGCLLELARELWNDSSMSPYLHTPHPDDGFNEWCWIHGISVPIPSSGTTNEGIALAKAIMEAPLR